MLPNVLACSKYNSSLLFMCGIEDKIGRDVGSLCLVLSTETVVCRQCKGVGNTTVYLMAKNA